MHTVTNAYATTESAATKAKQYIHRNP